MELFRTLNESGATIIQVTHSEVNASYGDADHPAARRLGGRRGNVKPKAGRERLNGGFCGAVTDCADSGERSGNCTTMAR